jgi:hypothetical protein
MNTVQYVVNTRDMELGHWVTGSKGHLGHLSRSGHRVTGSSLLPGARPGFFQLSIFEKCLKRKTHNRCPQLKSVLISVPDSLIVISSYKNLEKLNNATAELVQFYRKIAA